MPARHELELHELRQAFVEERARIIGDERRIDFDSTQEPRSLDVPKSEGTHSPALQRPAADSARLEALEVALEAFSQGEYGNCIQCGWPIRISRLHSNPDVSCCDACAACEEIARD